MKDLVRELLESARKDVLRSRMLYADHPAETQASAILKTETACELLRVYRKLKEFRTTSRNVLEGKHGFK